VTVVVLLGLKFEELSWDYAKPSQENNEDCLPCLFLQFCAIENGRRVSKILQVKISDGDPLISRKRILIYISGGLNSILFFIKHFLSLLKISKTFVFFLRTSSEYLTRFGQ
jgi:hypothetical protein